MIRLKERIFWAVQNPFKFCRKYVWSKILTYDHWYWILREPRIYRKAYMGMLSSENKSITITTVSETFVAKIKIVASQHTMRDAIFLQTLFKVYSLHSDVVAHIDIDETDQYLYILLEHTNILPKYYIVYQTKQYPEGFLTESYLDVVRGALCIFDSSLENIKQLRNQNISYTKIFFMPTKNALDKKNMRYVEDALFFLGRFLLNFDSIHFDTLYDITKSSVRLGTLNVLSMPETRQRREYITKILSEVASTYSTFIFDGVRRLVGHNGQGMGVKYLIKKAQEEKSRHVLICEDDIECNSGTKDQLHAVLEYANDARHKDRWDMISGFTTEFNDDYEVKDIFTYKGVTFIETNKIMGSVFVLYNETIYDTILERDEYDIVRENILDQFLKRRSPKILLVFPFLVTHHQDLYSTMWGSSNSEFRLNSEAFDLENQAVEYLTHMLNKKRKS